ncbi:MAG: YggT family protein [Succinivibrio sp.]|nr:YggT family protein [Succinivibrio sp.]
MNNFTLFLYVAEAAIMLFELRALMENSAVNYYHPFSQAVVKLTSPLLKLLPRRAFSIGSFNCAGFAVALFISLIFWLIAMSLLQGGTLALGLLLGVLCTVKCLGYLLVGLMLVQAITSWLPATQSVSVLLGEITRPVVAPVQKIIPPIGMIDISLMVVLLAIFALDRLLANLLGYVWLII